MNNPTTGPTLSIDSALAHAASLLRQSPALAAEQTREIVAVDPANADAHRLLGRALRALGDEGGAEKAELDAISASTRDPVLVEAATALLDQDLSTAERILRPRLKENPFDVAAIRMMAELAGRLDRLGDAENLLRRALELAPGFNAARANLATVLHKQNRPSETITELDRLLKADPENAAHQNLKAAALGRVGGYDEAVRLYAAVLERFPDQPKVWMSYGHVLKTVGKQAEGIAAYRRAIGIAPHLGEVWWSLANLKTVQFDDADIAAMTGALVQKDLDEEDCFHLHFALGKAHDDRGAAALAFTHYAKGNDLRRAMIDNDPREFTRHAARSEKLFTPAFFTARANHGCNAPDPIFILGMPRAGSTLIEQILSSHPLVEGTMELPDIPAIAKRMGGTRGTYLDVLEGLSAKECRALGEEYLERTRVQRKTDKPYFIDKMPNNWAHVGLIQLILPHARIIDARRHPLDCGFSNFRQHFARGQSFSYALDDMGLYYRDYVHLMRAFDAALPGRVHRIIHEALVDDTEVEVRRMLDALGLPFDEACLRFWENDRAVRTASSEQVRRPINRDGMDQWRPYEIWLDPLKQALGDVLTSYPDVPGH